MQLERRFFRCVALLVGVTTQSALALGAGEHDVAAQALFDEGKRLAAEGRWSEACGKLEESQRLDPSGGTLLHLAVCHEQLGKTATAWAELNAALSLAIRDGRADRAAAAQARLELLRPRLSTLRVVLSPEAQGVKALVVEQNGTRIGSEQLGLAIPVDPGTLTIRALAPGYASWEKLIEIAPAAATVEVAIPALEALPASRPEPAPVVPSAAPGAPARLQLPPPREQTHDRGSSAWQTAGYALGGAGIVGLGVAGFFAVRTSALVGDRDRAAAAGDAPRTYELHDQAKDAELVTIVAGSAGALLTGAGIAILLSRSGSTSNAASAALGVSLGAGHAALTANARF